MKRADIALIVLVILLVIVLIAWVVLPKGVRLQPAETTSQVSVSEVIEILPSAELDFIIDFGQVETQSFDNQALENGNGAGGGTLYSVRRGSGSTVDVEVCISADRALETAPGVFIPLPSETFDYALTAAGPTLTKEKPMTLDANPSLASDDLVGVPGLDTAYYRFWLDVSNPAQAPGTYTNQITFTAQAAGSSTSCPSN